MNDLILEWTLLDDNRIIIVEGINDKRLIQKVLREKVPIICTYGTFGIEKFEVAELEMLPKSEVTLGKEDLAQFEKLIDALEDDEDVQKVYHNVDL